MAQITPFPLKPAITHRMITAAVNEGIDRYFDTCRQRIPRVIDQHFTWPGAIATNQAAWGWDLLRAPLNLFWAPVYTALCLLRFGFRQHPRTQRLANLLNRVPGGLTTQVQRHIATILKNELLGQKLEGQGLDDFVIASLKRTFDQQPHPPLSAERFHTMLAPLVEDALTQYHVTRTASADITNSLSCTLLGAFAFQKFTPGGIGIGFMLASMLSHSLAVKDFPLGESLGQLYYSVFPATPAMTTTVAMMLLVMTCLATIAALSGIVTDPLQSRLGIHRRRLHKLIDHLALDMQNNQQSSFRPKDQFIARVMDTFDMIRAGLV